MVLTQVTDNHIHIYIQVLIINTLVNIFFMMLVKNTEEGGSAMKDKRKLDGAVNKSLVKEQIHKSDTI